MVETGPVDGGVAVVALVRAGPVDQVDVAGVGTDAERADSPVRRVLVQRLEDDELVRDSGANVE